MKIKIGFVKWLEDFNKLRIKLKGDGKSIWNAVSSYDQNEKDVLHWFLQYKLVKYTWLLAIATWVLAIATIVLVIFSK